MSEFQKNHSFNLRHEEAVRIMDKYPDRVPIIVEKDKKSKSNLKLDKKKFLVPRDLTVGQFIYVIRKRMILPSEKALYVFVKNTQPPSSYLIDTVYEAHKDKDKFLYMTFTEENTFG